MINKMIKLLNSVLVVLVSVVFVILFGLFSKAFATVNDPISITISPKSSIVDSGESQSYTVSAADEQGNIWDVTSLSEYSISAGAGGSWSENTYTSFSSGFWTVTATYLGLTDEAQIKVNPAVVGWELTSNLSDKVAGSSFDITVAPKDVLNNTITDYDWSNPNNFPTFSGLGNIGPLFPQYEFISSNLGVATFKVTVFKVETLVAIKAQLGSSVGYTNQFNIDYAKSVSIEIDPKESTISLDSFQQYSVTARDLYGNSRTVDTHDGLTLSVLESGHGGIFVDNTYFPGNVGTWTIRGFFDDVTDEAKIVVKEKIIESLSIDPTNLNLANADQNQSYTVTAYDLKGNNWDVTSEAKFYTNDPKGHFQDNIYYAGKVGTWEIKAQIDGVEVSTNITVHYPGSPKSMEIIKPSEEIFESELYQFEIKVLDKNGNRVSDLLAYWEVIFHSGSGVIDQNGKFIGLKPGKVSIKVIVIDNNFNYLETIITFTIKEKLVEEKEQTITGDLADSDKSSLSKIIRSIVPKVEAAEIIEDTEEPEKEPSDDEGQIMGTEIATIGPDNEPVSKENPRLSWIISMVLATIILGFAYYGYNYFSEPKMAEVDIPVKKDISKSQNEIKKAVQEEISINQKNNSEEIIKDIPKQDEDNNDKLRW